MKRSDVKSLVALSFVLAMLASTSSLNSQGAPAALPVTATEGMLIRLKTANDELLQKQEKTLEQLNEIKKNADQMRIFISRG
jgi:hypothetical protein